MDFAYNDKSRDEGSSGESDDGMEWEEVVEGNDTQAGPSSLPVDTKAAAEQADGIEVMLKPGSTLARTTISKGGKSKGTGKRPAGFTVAAALARAHRLELHKVHTACLLIAGHVRNGWLNDHSLQARLLSKCPLKHQNRFFEYSKATHPNPNDRSRLFETAVRHLTAWWKDHFFIEEGAPDKPIPGNILKSLFAAPHGFETLEHPELTAILAEMTLQDRTRFMMPFAEDEELRLLAEAFATPNATSSPDSKGKKRAAPSPTKKAKLPLPASAELGELIRNSQSLAKRAVRMSGTRDVSAQLFTCLCRSLDIPARLVFAMPVIDYRSAHTVKKQEGPTDAKPIQVGQKRKRANGTQAKAKGKVKGKGKARASEAGSLDEDDGEENHDDDDDEEDFEEVEIPTSMPSKAFKRTAQANGHTGDASSAKGGATPVKNNQKNSVASIFAKRKMVQGRAGSVDGDDTSAQIPIFWTEIYNRSLQEWIIVDPVRNKIRPRKGEFDDGRLFYVVAYEVDQYIKDVTPRYARSFVGRTMKMRIQSRKKDDPDWWDELLKPWSRPFVLGREVKEDEDLARQQNSEPMPAKLEEFKGHLLYVLERHLKREEVIPARTRQLGLFRGEPVFPRAAVTNVKSAESWMREGRSVKEGEQPMKMVKQRAVTIIKRRMQEMAQQEGNEPIMQGLYSCSQTELVIPPPIVNGIIPKNSYGNLDLFAPHMLPRGAVQIPFKNARKVAKDLGIDFAEAVTSFEFHKRRAIPVVSGIVVAAENEGMVLEAYWEAETAAMEKDAVKKRERCLKRWKKLIIGLRVRSRIQGEYKGKSSSKSGSTAGPSGTEDSKEAVSQLQALDEDEKLLTDNTAPASPLDQTNGMQGGFINTDALHPSVPGGAAFPPVSDPQSQLALPPDFELPPMPEPEPQNMYNEVNITDQMNVPSILDNGNTSFADNSGEGIQLDSFSLGQPVEDQSYHGNDDATQSNVRLRRANGKFNGSRKMRKPGSAESDPDDGGSKDDTDPEQSNSDSAASEHSDGEQMASAPQRRSRVQSVKSNSPKQVASTVASRRPQRAAARKTRSNGGNHDAHEEISDEAESGASVRKSNRRTGVRASANRSEAAFSNGRPSRAAAKKAREAVVIDLSTSAEEGESE